MGHGKVCTVADKRDGDGDEVVEIMTATRIAELCGCAMIDGRAAVGTTGDWRIASIFAMIEECHAAGDVEANCSRKRGRLGRPRVDWTRTRCYWQIDRISKGGFGFVVKAEHGDTLQIVAMKTLPGAADAGVLLREACFLAVCHGHPNLVGLHGVVRNPRTKQYSLVMEYVGPSLSDVLDERVKRHGRAARAYAEATVRRTMYQLLRGVKAMHDHRIIHRDIKPSNILVGEDGDVVKTCNFGLAMSTAEASPPYNRAGTFWYMAPEVMLETREYDELIDMWSLGCVMAELLSGEAPFQGEDTKDQLHKIFGVLGFPGKKTRNAFKIFDVLNVPGKKTRNAFKIFDVLNVPGKKMRLSKSKSKRLGYEVRQWQAQQQPEQHAGDQLRVLFPEKLLSHDGFSVLKGLLTFNPNKRLTEAAALSHQWFAGADTDDASRSVAAPLLSKTTFRSGAAALLRKAQLFMAGVVISAWAFVRLSFGGW